MRANRRITMRTKRHTPEEIVSKLRQVDVLVSQGQTVVDAIRTIGVTEVDRDRKLAASLQHDRPHASLGYRPPAPEVFGPACAPWPAALTRPAPPARLPVAQRPTRN